MVARCCINDILRVVLIDKRHALHARIPGGVKSSCLYQGFYNAAICLACIYPIDKIMDVLKWTVGLTLCNDAICSTITYTADAGKAKANTSLNSGKLTT